MAITFEKTPLEWQNPGTEPSTALKENGFSAGYKPAASTFNYQINNTSECLTELQTKLSDLDGDAIKGVKGNGITINPSSTGIVNITPNNIGAATSTHYHNASQITSGTLPIERGGTGATTIEEVKEILGVGSSGVGKSLAGQSVQTGYMQTTIAGTGAEIFNNYETRVEGIMGNSGGNIAVGTYSHATGDLTSAIGDYSSAGGHHTTAKGFCSSATGYRAYANNYQFACGRWNKSSSGPTDADGMTGDLFLIGNGTISGNTANNAFRVTTTGGVYGLKSYSSSGADYAEYFEWLDENPDNEDRRGYFVTLDRDKIRKATDKDEYILGVVSATPAVEGDSQSENWSGMYLKDIFGEKLIEVVEVEETTDEHGKVIPAYTSQRWILNPKYDSSLSYENRENRKEWSAIGLMGKLVVIDDGTCQENGYCKPNENGIATASETGYRVMKRLDENHVRIVLK